MKTPIKTSRIVWVLLIAATGAVAWFFPQIVKPASLAGSLLDKRGFHEGAGALAVLYLLIAVELIIRRLYQTKIERRS